MERYSGSFVKLTNWLAPPASCGYWIVSRLPDDGKAESEFVEPEWRGARFGEAERSDVKAAQQVF